ncbi:tetratricopeptide repeat protein [Aliikangiella sp. G2MR2-5]|uniref:ATP-binding protein n=1 Tax=Aliikangiella sp. G2MR2-5 TaxID=2788943 RepID=UPI0018A8BDD5|nr:tetratricopeptide repeat protein [Aliikangiella sp. G2MR2-5]
MVTLNFENTRNKSTAKLFVCFLTSFLLIVPCPRLKAIPYSDNTPPASLELTLNQKAQIYDKEQNLEKKLKLGNEIISQLSAEEEFEQLANFLISQATIYLDLEKYDQAIITANRSLSLAEKYNLAKTQMTIYSRIAEAYWFQGKLDLALINLENNLKIAEKLGLKNDISSTLHNIGLMYRHMGYPEKTLDYYTQSIQIKEELGIKSESLANAYNSLGVIYNDLDKIELAEKQYKKAIVLMENLPNSNLAAPLHNLGQLHEKKKSFDTALDFYLSSLEYEKRNENKHGIAISHREIGKLYLKQKNIDKAEEYLLESQKITNQLDSLILKADISLALARLYLAQEKIQKAKDFSQQGLQHSIEAKEKQTQLESYLLLSEIYQRSGEYQLAYDNFKLYHQTQAEISAEKAKQQIRNLEAQKSIELHRQEAEKLIQEKALQQEILNKELSLSRIWLVVAFVIFITVILVLIVFIMRRNLIQKEKVNQELVELDKMKDNFLSSTSHELLTPINGIVGLTQAIEFSEPSLSQESRESLKIITSCGIRLTSLLKNILDMSSFNRGQLSLNKNNTDLGRLITSAVSQIKPLTQEKGLYLKTNIPENPVILSLDQSKIEQVLFNLIGNAIKYTKHGGVFIQLKDCENDIEINVIDTGVGIPPEQEKYIFDTFSQVGGQNTEYGGAGIGLSISKALIQLHQGTLEYAPGVKQGSIFSIRLPKSKNLV